MCMANEMTVEIEGLYSIEFHWFFLQKLTWEKASIRHGALKDQPKSAKRLGP